MNEQLLNLFNRLAIEVRNDGIRILIGDNAYPEENYRVRNGEIAFLTMNNEKAKAYVMVLSFLFGPCNAKKIIDYLDEFQINGDVFNTFLNEHQNIFLYNSEEGMEHIIDKLENENVRVLICGENAKRRCANLLDEDDYYYIIHPSQKANNEIRMFEQWYFLCNEYESNHTHSSVLKANFL